MTDATALDSAEALVAAFDAVALLAVGFVVGLLVAGGVWAWWRKK